MPGNLGLFLYHHDCCCNASCYCCNVNLILNLKRVTFNTVYWIVKLHISTANNTSEHFTMYLNQRIYTGCCQALRLFSWNHSVVCVRRCALAAGALEQRWAASSRAVPTSTTTDVLCSPTVCWSRRTSPWSVKNTRTSRWKPPVETGETTGDSESRDPRRCSCYPPSNQRQPRGRRSPAPPSGRWPKHLHENGVEEKWTTARKTWFTKRDSTGNPAPGLRPPLTSEVAD